MIKMLDTKWLMKAIKQESKEDNPLLYKIGMVSGLVVNYIKYRIKGGV